MLGRNCEDQKFTFVVALLVLSIGGCFSSRPALGVERLDNVRFAEVDGQELFLDLYLPESSGPELVVYIHGGGWKGGEVSRLASSTGWSITGMQLPVLIIA